VAIKEQMVAYSNQLGGAEVRVYGYGPSFYGGGAGPPNYAIKVLGFNYETVRTIAEELGRRLQRFSRIRDVDVNSAGGWYTRDKASEFVLDLNRAQLGLYGLSARDVVYQVAAGVAGQVRPGNIRIGGEEVRFDVKLEGNEETDVLALNELLIQTSSGQAVRLADIATVRERDVLTRIVREDQQYQRFVSYEFRGPTKLGDRVRDAVIANTDLPEGYEIEGEQDWSWSSEEEQQIYTVLAIALVLIFMVTAALFESLRQGELHPRSLHRRHHDGRHRGEQRHPARGSHQLRATRGGCALQGRHCERDGGAGAAHPHDQHHHDFRAPAPSPVLRVRRREHLERLGLRADRRACFLDDLRADGDAGAVSPVRAPRREAAAGAGCRDGVSRRIAYE
jgi:hypothetical protein